MFVWGWGALGLGVLVSSVSRDGWWNCFVVAAGGFFVGVSREFLWAFRVDATEVEEPEDFSDAVLRGSNVLTLVHHGRSSARPLDQCLDERTSSGLMAGSWSRATAASCTQTSEYLTKLAGCTVKWRGSLTRSLEPLQQKQQGSRDRLSSHLTQSDIVKFVNGNLSKRILRDWMALNRAIAIAITISTC